MIHHKTETTRVCVGRWSPTRLIWMGVTGAALLGACRDAPPESVPIALTPVEYNNTIRDLLGMPADGEDWPKAPEIIERLSPSQGSQAGLFGSEPITLPPWPWEFPEEAGVDHYEGMADGQSATPYLVEELQKAAVYYGAYTLSSPTFFACEKWASLSESEQIDCGWKSLERFAERAWRRPLTDETRSALQTFWETQLQQGTPEEALVLTASGILQSPQFLFRIEQADRLEGPSVQPLDDWELAARLSYFLWDSMPDAELVGAAASGALSSKKGLESQARRMLENPKARKAVVHFHHQWLGTSEIQRISPARRAYGPLFGISKTPALDVEADANCREGAWPGLLGPIRHSMDAETYLFIASTLFDGAGTFEALLTDHHGYMSDVTAPIYGENVTPTGGENVNWKYEVVVFSEGSRSSLEMRPVAFSPQERAGVLTLPSVLALGSYPVHPSPVQRGKHILERLACEKLGSPPPGAEAEAPPDVVETASTNRLRTEATTSPANCVACHETINPPGFAFENYDAMGVYRTTDNGLDVDASGSFTLRTGQQFSFSSGVDLARQLATSPQVQDCYVKQWAQYATGVHLDEEHPELLRLQNSFRMEDKVKELLVSIITSDLFRFRRSGGNP